MSDRKQQMLKGRLTCTAVVLLAAMVAPMVGCGRDNGPGGENGPSDAAIPSRDAAKVAIDEIIQPLIDDQWARAVVVGTVTEQHSEILSYGQLSVNDPGQPDADTVFEIGSLTKVFTALLLADMVQRGEVLLDDPIHDYLPADVQVPTGSRGDIRLVDLATHTSSLPNVAANFWEDGDNIYDPDTAGRRWSGYTQNQLFESLRSHSSPIGEKAEFAYSNLGMGLLGHLLELKSGKSYEELLIERICEPLEMNNTRLTLNKDMMERRAQGHNADSQPSEPWDGQTSALAGAFAIRSTPHDLMVFLKANLGLTDSPLSSAIAATHTERFKRNDLEQVGLGWNLNKYGVVFHSGTTGGFRCSMFLLPELKVGTFVITDTQVGGATDARAGEFEKVGGSLINALVGAPPLPLTLPKAASRGSDQLTDFIGQYNLRPDDSDGLRITVVDEKLHALIPGRVTRQLHPQAKDTFFMKEYDVELAFERDDEEKVQGVSARIGGRSQALRRVLTE
ncbi:MAG: serine hydrolase domain-containing protein [Fuerstiella sp.]